jgi:hypothetical protein
MFHVYFNELCIVIRAARSFHKNDFVDASIYFHTLDILNMILVRWHVRSTF